MAKTPSPTPTAQTFSSVNHGAESLALPAPINAPDVATPENTPIPGGGRWAWDNLNACWVETTGPESFFTPFPTLE